MALMMKATVNWGMYLDDIQDYFENDAPAAWRKIFRPILRALMIDHGKRIGLAFGLTFDVQMLQARNWFNTYLLKFAQDIITTTRDTIATVVNTGITEGWSIDTMAQRIGDFFDQWMSQNPTGANFEWYAERRPQYRLEMIARTETIRASNAGATELYQEWGVRRHQWLSTQDERTRSYDRGDDFDHVEADRQEVAIGTPFTVSGESLMYPGDPAGSAGNIINCRCTTIPVIASDKARKYDPDQPRVPAGNPDGGQWTDGDGGNIELAKTEQWHTDFDTGEQTSEMLGIYEVNDASKLVEDYRTIAVGIRGENKNKIIASAALLGHSYMLDLAGMKDNIDNYVRFTVEGERLMVQAWNAGVVIDNDDDLNKAIDNIYKAVDRLHRAGLSGDIKYSVLAGSRFLHTTTIKSIGRPSISNSDKIYVLSYKNDPAQRQA